MPGAISSAATPDALPDAIRSGWGHLARFWRDKFVPRYDAMFGEGDPATGGIAGSDFESRVRSGYTRDVSVGLKVLAVAAGIFGGWALLVPMAGAVVVPGTLVVESNVKRVQHPTGGVVSDIAVRDGMHVKAGDLLIRLDETQVLANYRMLAGQLDQVQSRIARLVAERDDKDAMAAPDAAGAAPSADGEQALQAEKTLFTARALARHNEKQLLESRIRQLEDQATGLAAQVSSKGKQIELIANELEGVKGLYQKGLVPLTRLTNLQREAAQLEGERGQFQASIAEVKSKVSEAQLQILRIGQDFRTEVMKDLREAQDKAAELTERAKGAQDLLKRIDIRAPTSGVVHELSVHTIGGVISGGETIMEVVPDADNFEIEARLPPQDVDQVRVGQKTFARFSAFNQRTTPQVGGTVNYVSADLSRDRLTNAAFYTVRVVLPDEERRRLGDLQLVAGMPADVFIQTGSRTLMSYLFRPISEQFERSFIER